MKPISEIIKKYKLSEDAITYYGKYIAKLNIDSIKGNKQGKLILVTATSPTSSGEGKTTISINLTDGLNKIGKNAIVALREPSIGPCFGVKGGATGAGKASIVPEEAINLHFTGDFHAITTANNLIAACIDNEIYQNSDLDIDPQQITHTRVMDMNDRSLRNTTVQINKDISYTTRFDITSSCELMTIFVLSKDKKDFENRLNNMVVAYSRKGKPITVKQLGITRALMATMKDAFNPNIVQTLEGNMSFVHGGPFANISVGISSTIATKAGMKIADYVITEAGFGSDLGAEKFMNVLCQENGLRPACIVLVTTIKSIINQGNGSFENGTWNLQTHINHLKQYGLPLIVAINKFNNDTKEDTDKLVKFLKAQKVEYCFDSGFNDGAKGGVELARKVVKIAKTKKNIKFLYSPKQTLEQKIKNIVNNCYGIKTITYSDKAKALIKKYSKNNFYVCMSKQPGQVPTNYIDGKPAVCINDILVNTASKMNVVLCDKVFRMPGLPKRPKAKDWK